MRKLTLALTVAVAATAAATLPKLAVASVLSGPQALRSAAAAADVTDQVRGGRAHHPYRPCYRCAGVFRDGYYWGPFHPPLHYGGPSAYEFGYRVGTAIGDGRCCVTSEIALPSSTSNSASRRIAATFVG